MNVILKPSGSYGHSFKGLHAYLSHDKDSTQTAERVDFIEMRNLATDDPEQAVKIMIATAKAQDALKRASGQKLTGAKNTTGPVLHVVLAFDKDEPTDNPEKVQKEIDDYLTHLGVDPARMRSKNKPKNRQFADEHQVIMYGHNDTDNYHVHLMINKVHPQTGLNLPSNHDQTKSSDWALEYSKRHGTDHKTPARAENHEARKRGEYVKAPKRKNRVQYEREQELKTVGNDNNKLQNFLDTQRKQDASLYQRGRDMHELQLGEKDRMIELHHERKAAIDRWLQSSITKTKAQVREEFRPRWRKLKDFQKKERATFEGLENNFFGQAGNAFKTIGLSTNLLREDVTNVIRRTFAILTNAGDRKSYFERAQKRAQQDLKREQNLKLDKLILGLKNQHRGRLKDNRTAFKYEREHLKDEHEAKRAALQKEWQQRNKERLEAFAKFKTELLKITKKFGAEPKAKPESRLDRHARELAEKLKTAEEFKRSRKHKGDDEREIDKDKDKSDRGENER